MQILLNGTIDGLAIALLAVAFQLVYLPTRILFIGLAALYSLAPYLYAASLGMVRHWIPALALCVSGVVLLSVLFERFNHLRLRKMGASDAAHLISSLGLYIVVVELVAVLWGNVPMRLRTGIDPVTELGGVVIADAQWLMVGVTGTMLLLFFVLLRTTGIGLRLRALADNPSQLALYGYDVERLRLGVFALAAVFAAMASMVRAYDIGFSPHDGLHAVLLAVVAVVIGGRFSFAGPAIGGILIGLIRAQVIWAYSARWQDAATFLVLAAFILLRPNGLFGREARLETSN